MANQQKPKQAAADDQQPDLHKSTQEQQPAVQQAAGEQAANEPQAAQAPAQIRPVKAEPVCLRARMTLEDAFQSIGVNCMRQIDANIPGVLHKNVESLHQMRVGLRRLRALLAMFEDLAAPPVALHAGIEWLSGELGPARDWDVLTESTLDKVQGIDAAALRQAAHERAVAHHAQILFVLREPRFDELMAQLNDWLQERRWRPDGVLPKDSALHERAWKGALPLLRKAEKRLAKRIDGLDESDAPGRHRVRIAAKKARYAAEFFRDLLPARRVKRYVGHLEGLQDRLGALNDLAVAEHLLDELKGGSSQVAKQAAYARGYVAASSEAGVRGLGKALKDVAKRRITR